MKCIIFALTREFSDYTPASRTVALGELLLTPTILCHHQAHRAPCKTTHRHYESACAACGHRFPDGCPLDEEDVKFGGPLITLADEVARLSSARVAAKKPSWLGQQSRWYATS